jgi:hypothetical protein
MWLFRKKDKGVPLAPRTVFLIKHDGWVEVHKTERSDSGYCVKLSENNYVINNYVILLSSGKIVGTRSVVGWLPHLGWPQDIGDQFEKLKESFVIER